MNYSDRTGAEWSLSCTACIESEMMTHDPRTHVYEAKVHTYELLGCPPVSEGRQFGILPVIDTEPLMNR